MSEKKVYVRFYNGSDWLPVGSGPLNYDLNRSATGSRLAFSDSGTPYVAWYEDNASAIMQIYVKRLNGTNWELVGGTNSLNVDPGRTARNPDLAFDGTTPHVSWEEWNGTVFHIREKYFNGSSWIDRGIVNINGTSCGRPSISLFNSTPYVAYQIDTNNSDVAVRYYSGFWTSLAGQVEHVLPASAINPNVEFGSTGFPYVAWREQTGGYYQIYVRYYNGSWMDLGASLNVNSLQNAMQMDLQVLESTPWVAWGEDDGVTTNMLYLKRWSGSTWIQMGGNFNWNSNSSAAAPSLAFSNGTPYVAWEEMSGIRYYVHVKRYLPDGTMTTTPTNTPGYTVTRTSTPSLSATGTCTGTPSSTPTGSASATLTSSPTPTATPSPTPSISPTSSPTRTHSSTASPTITTTATFSRTPTITPTITPTHSQTPSTSPTRTATPTITLTWTPSPPDTVTVTPSLTITLTVTKTYTGTPSTTATSSVTTTSTWTFTLTETPIATFTSTGTRTSTVTPSPVLTATPTGTRTVTTTISPTRTLSATITLTPTITPTLPPTATPTPAVTFYLGQNTFRPGDGAIQIKLGLVKPAVAEVEIYTLVGRRVWHQSYTFDQGGYRQSYWEGKNSAGEFVAAGVYLAVLKINGRRSEVRKLIILK